MPVVITCPSCQRKARVPRAAIGKTIKCPSCGTNYPAVYSDLPSTTRRPPVADEPSDSPSRFPAEDDAGRTERIGIGLMTVSEGLLAASLALQLLLALTSLVADGTASGPALQTVTEIAALVMLVGAFAAIIGTLVGAVYCSLAPGPLPLRAAAVAMLVLTLFTAQPFAGTIRDRVAGATGTNRIDDRVLSTAFPLGGLYLLFALPPVVYEAGRQAMIAVYARGQAQRVGDDLGARMALIIAIGFPVVVIGLNALNYLAVVLAGKPQPRFDRIVTVLDQLARTILVAWGAFVFWRIWSRLRPE
jgi:hypothetical protein